MPGGAVSLRCAATCNASRKSTTGRRRVNDGFPGRGRTMKAIRINGFGGPEVLELDDVPVPQPGENELLVRIHAASINPVDYKIRRGTVPWVSRDMLPLTLGRDLSGTVESVSDRIDGFGQGDAVYAMLGSIDRGSYAEYVRVRPNEAAPKPVHLSHIEAAAVPLAALTAWQGLFD